MKLKTLTCAIALACLYAGPAAAQEKLYLTTWSNFVDQELFKKFEKETGIEIVTDSFDSNEAMMAKLQAGNAYDVASVSSYYVQPAIAAGLVSDIDYSKALPNWKNVSIFAQAPDYDPGHMTVPNSFGTVGVIVNRKVYQGTIKTWQDFYHAGGNTKIGMIDDPNAVFTTAYSAAGKPLCDSDIATYEGVQKMLLAQKPSVLSYAFSGAIERIAAGDVGLQLGWYTFVHQNLKTKAQLEYIVPEGPAYAWIETFFIPKTAQHVDAAKKFLDFMLRPENSGHFNNFVGYVPPVDGAEKYLSDELKKSPELATAKTREIVFQKACPADVIQAQTRIWEKLMKE